MCTISLKNPELQIAEEDIVVYKYIHPVWNKVKDEYVYMSDIKSFVYEIGKVYETELEPFKRILNCAMCGDLYKSGKGFYSYKEFISERCNAKFIIPKGAKYYLCENEIYNIFIYHSDKIKLVELI